MRTLGVTKLVRLNDFKEGTGYLCRQEISDTLFFLDPLISKSHALATGILAESMYPHIRYFEYTTVNNHWWVPYTPTETRWYQCCNDLGIYKRIDPERIAPWALEELVGLVFKSGEVTPVVK